MLTTETAAIFGIELTLAKLHTSTMHILLYTTSVRRNTKFGRFTNHTAHLGRRSSALGRTSSPWLPSSSGSLNSFVCRSISLRKCSPLSCLGFCVFQHSFGARTPKTLCQFLTLLFIGQKLTSDDSLRFFKENKRSFFIVFGVVAAPGGATFGWNIFKEKIIKKIQKNSALFF